MFKKTITYTDYNGEKHTEDFYFHLNKAEIIEMETSEEGGYIEMIKRVVEAKDMPTIMKVFKTFILKSYGLKSADGKRFEKSEEISKAFEQSEAYSELFMELCSNPDEAAKFVSYIIPLDDKQRAEVQARINEENAKKSEITELPSSTSES